jgi:hypothetical protein
MKRKELRTAMRRAYVDGALKLLAVAFGDCAETDTPSDRQQQILDLLRQEYNDARNDTEVTDG